LAAVSRLKKVVPVWAVWRIIFHRTDRDTAPTDGITKQCSYLLKGRGSILELLVAVPTHLAARARNYCCAGFSTFLGIAFGVSVDGLFLWAGRVLSLRPTLEEAPVSTRA
jgi:hypothetical protein